MNDLVDSSGLGAKMSQRAKPFSPRWATCVISRWLLQLFDDRFVYQSANGPSLMGSRGLKPAVEQVGNFQGCFH